MKPINCDVEFKYQCDKCGAVKWLTAAEVKVPGFVWVCCQPHRITTIKKISVRPEYIEDVEIISKKAYLALKQFGYSLEEIKKIQETVLANNAEELVKKFLQRQQCSSQSLGKTELNNH